MTVIEVSKKFKEYRMFLLCLFLFIVFLVCSVETFFEKNPVRFLAMIILLFVALFLLTTRFKIILFEDMMIIYEWKYVALLPTVINYKDIQSIQKKSKHCVEIIHHKKSHVYVFNSQKFIEEYNKINNSLNSSEAN